MVQIGDGIMLLFKYKKIDEKLLDMLINQYYYCAKADSFDDIFDGRMPFKPVNSKNVNVKFVKNIMNKELDFYFCNNRDNDSFKDLDKLLRECNLDKLLRGYNDDEYCCDKEQDDQDQLDVTEIKNQYKFKNSLLDRIENDKNYKKFFIKLFKVLLKIQDSKNICSFCEEKNNQVLWSMYANQFRGCCIEYDVPDKNVDRVKYAKRYKHDIVYEIIKRLYEKEKLGNINVKSIISKLMLTKDKAWSFQKEWRAISPEHKIDCDIKAVYLGYKVSKKNKDKVIKACQQSKKSIEIYEMHINYEKQTYDFRTIKKAIGK